MKLPDDIFVYIWVLGSTSSSRRRVTSTCAMLRVVDDFSLPGLIGTQGHCGGKIEYCSYQ